MNADVADARNPDGAEVADWDMLANSLRAGAIRQVPNGSAPGANSDLD